MDLTKHPAYFLDITQEVCPLTFVRTKLLIEKMRPGEVAEIRLRSGESLVNVPRSTMEMGHKVSQAWAEAGDPDAEIYRLRIEKGGRTGGMG